MNLKPFNTEMKLVVRKASLYGLIINKSLNSSLKINEDCEKSLKVLHGSRAIFTCEGETKSRSFWFDAYKLSDDLAYNLATQYKEINPSYDISGEDIWINAHVIVCLMNLSGETRVIDIKITNDDNPEYYYLHKYLANIEESISTLQV